MEQGRGIYGIDLGTTYCCIAQIDRFGQPVVLRNFEGDYTTPSAVYFEDRDNIIVGKEAKEMLATEPENTVVFVKRDMGNDANQQNNTQIRDVVITCPAYFGTKERLQTRKAGEMAGLNVLSIINEPTAAAIAYGIRQHERRTFIVYDLGGGTFDVTFLVADHGSIEVVATGGDHHLGGADWDKKLATYLLTAFNMDNGTDYHLDDDPLLHGALMLDAENKKKLLTAKTSVKWNFAYGGKNARIDITREQFNDITSDLLEQTIDALYDVLDVAAAKGFNRFDELILVGGSSRMPQVKERIDREFGCDARLNDPDDIVAKGAAIYAMNQQFAKGMESYQKGLQRMPPESIGKNFVHVVNVTSKTYGLRMVQGENNEPIIRNFLFANTPLPCSATIYGSTVYDGQTGLESVIYESDLTDPVNDAIVPLECGVLINESNLDFKGHYYPKGTETCSTFTVDAEGILSAHVEVGNDVLDYTLQLKGVPSEQEVMVSKSMIASKNIQ